MPTLKVTSAREGVKSGRFVLRMAPGLHAALERAACAAGVSLNEYCVRRLAVAGAGPDDGDAAALVSRAAAIVGDGLTGVLLHGSWARGEATPASDVDALVVVEPRTALRRALYRAWDEHRVRWRGRRVDPHFVHPPGPELSGLWAEAAIDGRVLFDRDGRLAADLARVRHAIAAGRLVRRTAHGQPYWTEVA